MTAVSAVPCSPSKADVRVSAGKNTSTPWSSIPPSKTLGALPPTRIISKTRYRIRYRDDLVWSFDRFGGPNTGLIIAEVELAHPEQHIELPSWVGEEITFNLRYGNSELARSPIRN